MKLLLITLAVAGYTLVSGCSRDISSEGKILQVIKCRLRENAPSEAIEKAEDAMRALPSKTPVMERFEWGRATVLSGQEKNVSHCMVVLFKDPQSAFDKDLWRAGYDVIEASDQFIRPPLFGITRTYLVHDATPRVRTSTDGCIRRVQAITLKNATPEQMREFENTVKELPKQIRAIERLEWATETDFRSSNPKPINPAYRNGSYCLLFTFDSARSRDACVAHPAYKEFQRKYRSTECEYTANIEYVARPK